MRPMGAVLPRRFAAVRRGQAAAASQQLVRAARADAASVLTELGSQRTGLAQEEVERRLEQHGPNAVAKEDSHTRLELLGKALLNPLVLLLTLLATLSFI